MKNLELKNKDKIKETLDTTKISKKPETTQKSEKNTHTSTFGENTT